MFECLTVLSKPVFLVLLLALALRAQSSTNPPPDERYKADLLVVVAHPDDETEIGAYLARIIFDEHKRVAVVFGNHGATGGNAEGQEQSQALADVREIEARRALEDFGVMNVWFLAGRDTAGQDVLRSLENWDHADQLGRMVRIVRLTRPSVVATWLPDYVAGENHGDHQAAGVIATEAFDLAGDPAVFSEQVATPRNRGNINNLTEGLRPWQAQKVYYFTDASHTDFLAGKGPVYSSTDKSPSRKVSYARLAAEECSFHLTQGETGQMARESLQKNDLHYFEQPVRLIFGKSLVPSSPTADVFEGVRAEGIAYQRPPGFLPPQISKPFQLGGPWQFYRTFWAAHGLMKLAQLVGPETLVNYESPFTVPLVLDNPTDQAITVPITVKVPQGWIYWRRPPAKVSVGPHSEATFSFEVRSPVKKTGDTETKWAEIAVSAGDSREVRLRIGVDSGAMPQ
jgi:LmbE family N-acetylglucosaminyl deacetylase